MIGNRFTVSKQFSKKFSGNRHADAGCCTWKEAPIQTTTGAYPINNWTLSHQQQDPISSTTGPHPINNCTLSHQHLYPILSTTEPQHINNWILPHQQLDPIPSTSEPYPKTTGLYPIHNCTLSHPHCWSVLWIRKKSFRIRIRAALIQKEFETKLL